LNKAWYSQDQWQWVLTSAFAALTRDGSIKAWGDQYSGGKGAPSGSGYTKIYSNRRAFAVLTHNGSIKVYYHWVH
jgi:hypothetical protein